MASTQSRTLADLCQQLIDGALSAGADQAEAIAGYQHNVETRLENNDVHTVQTTDETMFGLRVFAGGSLGFIATKTDRWDEALDWYLKGLRLDPGSPDILSGLFRSYLELGRNADAENVLERWLQFHPNDEYARSTLQELRDQLQGQGKPEEAGATSLDVR